MGSQLNINFLAVALAHSVIICYLVEQMHYRLVSPLSRRHAPLFWAILGVTVLDFIRTQGVSSKTILLYGNAQGYWRVARWFFWRFYAVVYMTIIVFLLALISIHFLERRVKRDSVRLLVLVGITFGYYVAREFVKSLLSVIFIKLGILTNGSTMFVLLDVLFPAAEISALLFVRGILLSRKKAPLLRIFGPYTRKKIKSV